MGGLYMSLRGAGALPFANPIMPLINRNLEAITWLMPAVCGHQVMFLARSKRGRRQVAFDPDS